MFAQRLLRGILGSITAQKCLICDDIFLGLGTCELCFSLIESRLPPRCENCGGSLESLKDGVKCINCLVNPPPFDRLWAEFDYEPVAGLVIQYAKKWGLPSLITHLLDASQPIGPTHFGVQFNGIVAIPDRINRYRRRGFSTSGIIAKRLAEGLGGVPILRSLTWTKRTERQSGLTKARRLKNMDGAFKGHGVSGQTLLIVDDVYTTGSTLKAASRALKVAGAEVVHGFALAYRNAPHSARSSYEGMRILKQVRDQPSHQMDA